MSSRIRVYSFVEGVSIEFSSSGFKKLDMCEVSVFFDVGDVFFFIGVYVYVVCVVFWGSG